MTSVNETGSVQADRSSDVTWPQSDQAAVICAYRRLFVPASNCVNISIHLK